MQYADYMRRRIRLAMLPIRLHTVEIRRPELDSFGQPTSNTAPIGKMSGWLCGGQHRQVGIAVAGTVAVDDRQYLLALDEGGLPDVHVGDQAMIDGIRYRIADIDYVRGVTIKYFVEVV